MNLSEKIKKVAPSPTLAISQKAGEMKRQGIDVISFSLGEPDFDTPSFIREAAKAAIDGGFTRYAPVAGIPELKEAVVGHINRNYGVKYQPSQVIATCGAKSAIFIALQVLLNPGDEVIIPAPYWVSYPEQVKLAGGVPVIAETEEKNDFKLTPDGLEKFLSKKTRLLIINSPSNPVGCIYSKKELNELIELCISKDVAIIADEIYDKLTYDGEFPSALCAHSKAAEHIIYINGVSKSYAMTGWRMGYAAGPEDVIKAMTKYQSQLLTSITTFVQKAACAALEAPDSTIRGMIAEFKKRRDLIIELIKELPGTSYVRPEGAFYVFLNIKNCLAKKYNGKAVATSQEFAEFLLNEAHIAVVPGSAFGAEGYIRLSFATSEELIREGIERIEEAIGKLSPSL